MLQVMVLAMVMFSVQAAVVSWTVTARRHELAAPTTPKAKFDLSRVTALRGGETHHSSEWSSCYRHDGLMQASAKHKREVSRKESPLWAELRGCLEAEETSASVEGVAAEYSAESRLEAASKLISNHDAITCDMTNPYALSQRQISRLPVEALEECDAAMREVARRLLARQPAAPRPSAEHAGTWVRACQYLTARLQLDSYEAPGRDPDMSAEGGAALRGVLAEVAALAASWKNSAELAQTLRGGEDEGGEAAAEAAEEPSAEVCKVA